MVAVVNHNFPFPLVGVKRIWSKMIYYFLGFNAKIGEDLYDTFGAEREMGDAEYADLVLEHGGAVFVSAEDMQTGGLKTADFEIYPSMGALPENIHNVAEEELVDFVRIRGAIDRTVDVLRRKREAHAALMVEKATQEAAARPEKVRAEMEARVVRVAALMAADARAAAAAETQEVK